MAHIHTQAGQHDLTASAFIIRLDGPEPRLLLHKHKKLHVLMQFGGHVELNETPWQAVTHELAEESGYDIHQLRVLQPKIRIKTLDGTDLHPFPLYIQTHHFPGLDHYHTDIGFVFTTSDPPRFAVKGEESREIAMFTLSELKSIPDEEIVPNVRQSGIFVLTECLQEWETVDIP